MTSAIENFGRYAGKVWNELNKKGPMEESVLVKKMRIKEEDFHAAVGWLARENKIRFNNGKYELSPTNLTEKIGGNAGKVFNTLASYGEIDVSAIAKIAKIHKKDAYSAIGWLARENKIDCKKDPSRNSTVAFELK
ncbi:MAG: winged helix-turn-helix domain-containing protein [Thermoplasmatota archaeon]|jgi:hypothetical protein